ncbi:Os01g0170051 [Oryza sativa Japonica Group]|uniref:Os01g0170051 protein n=1 Tax=Oryza sativa subsp. japonica TaxID=39947 RepID=A0A0N7KCE7_ORYSJ|nr:Os01g0170051 [Oryza sativa Japonica Group]
MERVGEQAVARRQRVALAPEYGPIRQREAAEQVEVVAPHGVADVDGAAGDGAGGGVEGGAGVGGLEHVPVRVDEGAHPQRVVGAVHHVAALQPEGAVGVAGGVGAPEVVADAAQRHRLRAQQHEVVAVLHARDHAVAVEVAPHRLRQPSEVGLRELHPTAVLLAHHLQQMDDVDLDTVDAGGLEVGVEPLVELPRAARVDEPDAVVDDLVDGEVLHGALQARREPRRDDLRRRQARRAGAEAAPVPAQRVPHVHLLHRRERRLHLPHEAAHAALVLPELVVLLELDQPARHLLAGRRAVHPLGAAAQVVVVVADRLPAVVDQHQPRRAPAVGEPPHALPHPLRVHLEVERVPRAPPELVDDRRRRLLLHEAERAEVGTDHPHGVLDQVKRVVPRVQVHSAPEHGAPDCGRPALEDHVHVVLRLPGLEAGPEGPLDDREEEDVGPRAGRRGLRPRLV